MESNRSVPWTTRFCNYSNELLIQPLTEFKKNADDVIISKGILTKSQLDLIYSIIAVVGLTTVYFLLPVPVGGILAASFLCLEYAQPELFSKRTWAMLQLGGALYGLASTPSLLLFAFKIDSMIVVLFGTLRAVVSAFLVAENVDRLTSDYSSKRDNWLLHSRAAPARVFDDEPSERIN